MKKTTLALLSAALLTTSAISSTANATIVLFKTSMGDFEVNLFDKTTPQTVQNFLQYVENEDYTNSIVHRVAKDFVVQGGGFTFDSTLDEDGQMIGVDDIEDLESVENEPVYSNVRGTIAMAKLSGDEDSATNQWFFNVSDNSANLDNQNGGFTAFGTVDEQGMEIIDAINDLTAYYITPTFSSTPLHDVPAEGEYITDEHFVMVESITVVNANEDTEPMLPPLSTANNDTPQDPVDETPVDDNPGDDDDGGSSGGSLNVFILLGLFAGACKKALRK